LNSFGPSSLDILIYTFTKTTQWIPFQGIKQEIMLRILKIIESHGAEVAFPTTTLEVPDGIEMKEQKS
jgi:MscS family membrane protein